MEIAVFSLLLFCLAGCDTGKGGEPIWEQVKIGDLASAQEEEQPRVEPLKTMNFNVYIFEMPADNITTLNDILGELYLEPLRFADYGAFKDSSFSVGFGRSRVLNRVIELLQAGSGQKWQTVSLLLPDGQANDVTVARLYERQSVFYVSKGSTMEGESLGPGRLALRIGAGRIPGARGVCSVSVLPVFVPPTTSSIPQLAARAKADEFVFAPTGFGLRMSPGDFLLLGPEKYGYGQMTLSGYFFSRPAPSRGRMFLVSSSGETQELEPYYGPVVRTYLILCTGISY